MITKARTSRNHNHSAAHADELTHLRQEVAALKAELGADAQHLGESGVRVLRSAKHAAGEAASRVVDAGRAQVMQARESAQNAITQRPFASVAIAAAAGACAVGALLLLRKRA